MKKCFKCGIKKRLDLFYKHPQMGDGHLGKCKTCTKKDVEDRHNDPEARKRIVEYERKRSQKPERKAKIYEYTKTKRLKYPGKFKAHSTTCNAIRNGRLTRQPCEVCGAEKVQGHHDDYRKPLEVRWLCFKHHRQLHGNKYFSE